jgi:hypothetical protein
MRPTHGGCRVLMVLFALTATARGFAVEPWFANLSLFGPLATDGQWVPRPMQLVDDYTFAAAGLSARAGDQFMFVQVCVPRRVAPRGAPGPPAR